MLSVKLWGKEPRLKKWIELEAYKEKIIKATDGGDFPKWMLRFISVALGVREKYFNQADWIQIVSTFYLIIFKSPRVDLPITSPSDEKQTEEDWSYDGRMWHLYSHLIAKNYGWTLSEISQLHVDEALAKIQEILTDEQLEREFYYGLSEAAYTYDKNSKVSKFNPLPRPHWMRKKMQPIKKFLIPASMLPIGVGKVDGIVPDEYLPKEIHKT